MKSSAALLAVAATAVQASLQPIVMKGSKLFYENGTQFFMKGIAYQQDTAAAGASTGSTTYVDPLADEAACKRDVPLLKKLGTNIIRTYAIDPEEDHSACMKLLDAAGIYVISDLSEPSLSINRDDAAWNVDLYKRYTAVVDELAQYDNVVGFFAGNEVTNNVSNTDASAFVKAAVRDTKKHITDKNYRWLGVGYASNDDVDIRDEITAYFNCGDSSDSIDFWGYNIYSWCGESTMEKSSYSEHVKYFSNFSVPVFFAEYGCNEPDGAAARIFQETTALYSDEMTEVFSGGIVYMYFQEDNDYGVVKIDSNDKATQLKDFASLSSRVAAATPSGVESDSYKATNTAASCPDIGENWIASSVLPPTPDEDLCNCMVKSSSCVPSTSLKVKGYSAIFDYICGEDISLCAGINGNGTSGVYGAYSMCGDAAKLAYVLDAYYKSQNSADTACDFDGKATTQTASTASTCEDALASASSINAVAATATAGSSSNSTEDATNNDDSFGNPSAAIGHLFTLGDYAVGAYLVAAAGVGAGMVLL
ncbi:Glucanosyltransferase-domain-containing protein [Dactylonectria estremocensis]|uniref:1,3-beta-glucanosyltransferase n=1 Tax=Dactylonectria estremocensis TaxID=1079267 RepID=A0A9P9EP96_9HYPO|nr:Glucanosyltransferase-domain-containing protein [Dactylonectria estremocensis]